MSMKRIGILTGGGDCSGLNAVIRAVTRSAVIHHQARIIGFEKGFEGMIYNLWQELTIENTRELLTLGGTLLGSSNKGDPFRFRERDANGKVVTYDFSARAKENFEKLELDGLIAVGGEGTLEIAYKFSQMGLPVVGVPKTIDNDLSGTDYSFGFQTAVQVACDALDRLHTTGKSHQRVMILEVMGRSAGWIALEAGISGGAHIILLPEIPFSIEAVLNKIRKRDSEGHPFTVIVIAEGATEVGGSVMIQKKAENRLQGTDLLGGVGHWLANEIEDKIPHEVRCTVLGYTQRGGTPNAFDRILGTRLGAFAVRALAEKKYGHMVSFRPPELKLVPLAELAGKVRRITSENQLLQCAEDIGVSLGR
jgi:ATP-dependent phosphofructokinase / diphosphate-dependent phosphofructokinase